MAISLPKVTPARAIVSFSILLVAYRLLHPSISSASTNLSIPASWSTFGSIFTTAPPTEPDTLGFLPVSVELDAYCAHHRWRPYPDRYHRRKVYDLVFVEGEEDLDWLEIRMGEMAKGVDYFVILESEIVMRGVERWPWRVTVSGEESKEDDKMAKPLHVQESFSRFRRWHSKMMVFTLNLTMTQYPASKDPPTPHSFDTPLSRKTFINNALLMQTLPYMTEETTPTHGDVIIVSEVNEIVRPSVLQVLRNCEIPRHVRLWTKRFEGGFAWLGAARHGTAKPKAEASAPDPAADATRLGPDGTVVEGSPEQALLAVPELQKCSEGLGIGQWNHPDVTYFSGFRDTPLPASLRSEHEADSSRLPQDGEIHDAGWTCVTCFSSLKAVSERTRASVIEAKGIDEERNNYLKTLAFPTEIAKRIRMGVQVFPEQQQQRFEGLEGQEAVVGTSTGYLQRVEDMRDVPGFLHEADGKTPKDSYSWLFERDAEEAGFVDYWDVMEELEKEKQDKMRI